MKIFFEYEPNESGKGKMLGRLIPELENLGAKISFTPEGCDVKLALTRIRKKHKEKMPVVLRMDGIHLEDTEKNRWNNKRVRKSIKKADTVIYQSKFAKKVIEEKLKVNPKSQYVIYNGANPKDYKPQQLKMCDVIMVARWANRKQKKLKWMLEIAQRMPHLRFMVCGEISHKVPKAKNITYVGKIDEKYLGRLLTSSRCMLNLASYDWCPNAVVEAIVAGLPVIGYDNSGVGELIDGSGGYTLPFYASQIDIFDAINHCVENRITTHKPSLYIENIAKQYYQAFEETLCLT